MPNCAISFFCSGTSPSPTYSTSSRSVFVKSCATGMSFLQIGQVCETNSIRSALPAASLPPTVTALPASAWTSSRGEASPTPGPAPLSSAPVGRSEEHTSELQSHVNLVCRLLLEQKKKKKKNPYLSKKKKKHIK